MRLPFRNFVIKVAADLECDLIVRGMRGVGRGLDRLLFGSTAEKILRGASRYVYPVRRFVR
jgi:nucleotide-binding universal stress UspA family protein